MRKVLKKAALGALVVVAIIIVAGTSYRAYRQHQLAETLVIDTPYGIDEQRFVEANGIEHWITIRGLDRRNPIIFFVHGGPAEIVSFMPSSTQAWEREFTVVHWDQRGAGRTYRRNAKPPTGLTLPQMTDDGVKVVRWVTEYLDHSQVVLVGHSWGSILGLHMIFTQPELFAAYVGTGQFVAWTDQVKTQHAYAVARARDEEHSDVLAALADFDGPPSQDIQRYLEFRALTRRYLAPADLEFGSQQPAGLLLAPRVSVGDIWNALQGARASLEALTPALLSADLRQLGDDIPVPFVLLQGDSDRITPTSLAVKYFESVRAPSKVHVEISDAGHYAFVTHPNQFRESLVSKVLPLVAPSTQPDAD